MYYNSYSMHAIKNSWGLLFILDIILSVTSYILVTIALSPTMNSVSVSTRDLYAPHDVIYALEAWFTCVIILNQSTLSQTRGV